MADGYWQIGSPLKKDPNLRVWISTETPTPPPGGSGSCLAATTPETERANLAAAWEEGHREPWKRGPDECECSAWNSDECACGFYGTGQLVSLDANPYKVKGDTE